MTSAQFRVTTLAVIIAVIGGLGYLIWNYYATPGKYDGFAQCLQEKGVKFYGAYWCPHCSAQKKIFGKSAKKLPYIECALPGNPNAMVDQCKQAGVEGYPTWTFADGAKLSGEQTLQTLADRSGCTLPE